MKFNDAITEYIKENIDTVNIIYDWKINLTDFPDKSYKLEGDNNFNQNINLRKYINKIITEDEQLKQQCIFWYIKKWGGVKSNKLETLLRYVSETPQNLIKLEINGIASWSKALSIINPEKYSIYDARVALSLNSIQKIKNVQSPFLFPQLNSQNRTYVVPTQKLIKQSKFFEDSIYRSDFYKLYLEILFNSVNKTQYSIQAAEMILFSSSKKLSGVWHN